jgi:hypothetical protein
MTEANETEPNNDVAQGQKIELNTTVNGVITAPTDVDYVTFKAKAGQNVVVYCLTTSLDSKLSADITVATPDGKPLASNRNYRGGDAVLDFKAPADGEYVVRVAQFAYTTGGTDHFYRLTVTTGEWVDAVFPPLAGESYTFFGREVRGSKPTGEFNRPDGRPLSSLGFGLADGVLPAGFLKPETAPGGLPPAAGGIDAWVRDQHDRLVILTPKPAGIQTIDNGKNDTADMSQAVKPPCDIAGRIGKKNDRHWYSFDAKKGEVWTLEVFADRIGSPIDAYFTLTDEKGKVITEMDDGPDPLSPNQFYSKSDDPRRYRFAVPNDGKYRVMVSSRDAGIQFGVREQYVLRIAKENPDFRLVVMPLSTHLTDAGTLTKGGAVLFSVFVFRMDGFNDAITLTADNLPEGVKCPPQVIGTGQTRGTLVLTADKDAEDWDGFVTITGTAGKLTRDARPFTVTWPALNIQPNQPPPNFPLLTRMDRGPGLALAVRGDAPFTLTPKDTELKAVPGGKIDVTLKVARGEKFKDNIQLFVAVPNFGPRVNPNQLQQPVATVPNNLTEAKVSLDVPANLAPGKYTLVLRGQSPAPPPKGPVTRPVPTYPCVPVTVVVGKK